MNRLIEFAGNHPYLVAAAAVMVIIVIVSEMRARIQEFAAVAPADAIRMMNHGALVIDVRDSARVRQRPYRRRAQHATQRDRHQC